MLLQMSQLKSKLCLIEKKRNKRDMDTLKWLFKHLKMELVVQIHQSHLLAELGWDRLPKGAYRLKFQMCP